MLDHRILTDGTINPQVWAQRHRDRVPVGRCPCGAALVTEPGPPWHAEHGIRWYMAVCALGCGVEVAAPNGRTRAHAC